MSAAVRTPLSATNSTERGTRGRSLRQLPASTWKVRKSRLFTPMIRAPAFTAASASSAVWASTRADSPRLWATPMYSRRVSPSSRAAMSSTAAAPSVRAS